MTLDGLKAKLQDITLGDVGEDLYGYLQKFFSMEDTKAMMVQLNQKQNYDEQVWRDGTPKPVYAQSTLAKRERFGFFIPSSKQYTAHETGNLFRSMGVLVTHDSVAIVTTEDMSIALGIDFMDEGQIWDVESNEYIANYFKLYDPEKETLGLTDESLASMKEGIVNSVVNQLKAYLNG